MDDILRPMDFEAQYEKVMASHAASAARMDRLEAWSAKNSQEAKERAEHAERRMEAAEKRMEAFDKRMEASDKRMEASDKRMERYEQLSKERHERAMERLDRAMQRLDKADIQIQATRKLVESGMKMVVRLGTRINDLAKRQDAFLRTFGNGRNGHNGNKRG